MNAQQLKNSILQMAIQGKLIPQDPSDEPASVLLERIRQEKEQLVKSGQIKCDKHESVIYRKGNSYYETADGSEQCIDEKIPFEIPANWEWVRFKNLVSYSIGKTPPRKNPEYWDSPLYSWVSIADMPDNGLVDRTNEKVNQVSYDKIFKGKLVPKGTLLMSFKLTIGKVSILKIPAFHNEAIISIYPIADVNAIIRNYLFFVLPSLSNQGDTKSAIKGNTLNSESLDALLIPLPPLAEQERITAKIRELLPFIERYKESEILLGEIQNRFPTQLKKSILQFAVQGKLVPQDLSDEPASVLLERIHKEKEQLIKAGKIKRDKHKSVICRKDNSYYETVDGVERCIDGEIPFEIPDSWELVRLHSVASVLGGKRIPAGRKLTEADTGHIYIRVSDMKNNGVRTDSLLYVPDDIYPSISRYIINKEDIYITVAGTIGTIGKVPPILDGANLTENADRIVFCQINQDWLIYYLGSPFIQNKIAEATTKVGQPKLAIKRIEDFLIALPPLAEQQRIVAKVEELLPFIKNL